MYFSLYCQSNIFFIYNLKIINHAIINSKIWFWFVKDFIRKIYECTMTKTKFKSKSLFKFFILMKQTYYIKNGENRVVPVHKIIYSKMGISSTQNSYKIKKFKKYCSKKFISLNKNETITCWSKPCVMRSQIIP